MDPIIKNYLLNIELGKLQSFKNMGIIPLSTSVNHDPEYITLKEALEKNQLTVKEVSHGGSVPELKVINNAEIHILLLDGEELVGAKQDRVLNTTILLKKKSETIIPVSCTEHGRWSYVSEEFTDSGTVMSPKIRMLKARSVSASLHESRQYRSDQGAVWDAIDEMSEEAGVSSSTGAMKDVFESRLKELDEYLKAFKCMPDQKGMLVLFDGAVVGLDIVSRESAYKVLHAKLVKSYAMEAILQKKENAAKSKNDKAKAFIKEASSCGEKKYESIGNGWDYRYEGKKVVGSALLYQKKVIHMAFFRVTEGEKVGPMAGYSRRRGFRTD